MWYGLFAPKDTPADIIARYNKEVVAILGSGEARQAFSAQGLIPTTSTPAALGEIVARDRGAGPRSSPSAGSPPSERPSGDVLIVGAGVGGLTLALSLHQVGISCRVFEAAPEVHPLGVGINLLPHAMRELTELGLADMLARHCHRDAHARLLQPLRPAHHQGACAAAMPAMTGRSSRSIAPTCTRCCSRRCGERLGTDAVRLGYRCIRVDQDGSGVSDPFRPGRTRAGQARDRLRRHPFGAAPAALSRSGPAEIFRRQHVARRGAVARLSWAATS